VPPADAVVEEALAFGRWTVVLKFGYYSFGIFFVMRGLVVNLANAHQEAGIITGKSGVIFHLPLVGDLWNQGVCTMGENKPKSASQSLLDWPATIGKLH